MSQYRKNVHVSKLGPSFCFYKIEKKTPIFWGLFSIWIYEKRISEHEFFSMVSAEFLI